MSKDLGITSRMENFSDWYNELILHAGLADYSPIRGCMVIKPHGYAMWEIIQRALDDMFKETGHQNAYFPMFIPESFMKKEAEHIEGFAPECAVVTHGGGKPLEEPLYIRPTSETIIWNTFSKWIQSHRDLPLLINQWANVCRWEMRTRLFLRTTEFLWQEGHTAHISAEEAEQEALTMLECYRILAEDWLAIPVIVGKKSENEKFAGAEHTYCIEAMTQDLKAIQAGTSHNLGQKFAKAFNVTYASTSGGREFVYATSWGVSTRLIGTIIMVHSDDKGLVLPPRIAPIQVVIVPISRDEETRTKVYAEADKLHNQIKKSLWKETKVRVHTDKRDKETPGYKFNDWELKGACIRIELGPKDIEKQSCVIARRDTSEKTSVSIDKVIDYILETLTFIQEGLYNKAKNMRESNTQRIDNWSDFEQYFNCEGGPGFALAYWDGKTETELKIAEKTKATIRCIPLQPLNLDDIKPGKCVLTGNPSKQRVIFAKAY